MVKRNVRVRHGRGLVLVALITFCAASGWAGEAPRPLPRIAVLAMGLYPRPFTDVMDTSVAELLKHVALSKLN